MYGKRNIALALIALLAALILAQDALAMPMFARKYKTSCMTCHVSFPRRNAVGEAFRMNGFRFEDDEVYCKEAPVELGDEAYQRLFPEAVWPSDLPSNIPISISSRFLMETDVDDTRKNHVTMLLPEEIELVWAGTLGNDIAFYGDIIFLQKDFGGQPVQSWTTLKGWLEFRDVIGDNGGLNLRLGTVGTSSMGLFTALDANAVGTHFYQYTTWMLPAVDVEAAGIYEFEGNPFSIQPQMGIEINGRGKRWSYALGITAGNVMAPGNELPDTPLAFTGTARNLNNKDHYCQFAYKFGGLPFDGVPEGGEQGDPLAVKSDFWRDDSLTLSAFGYLGNAQIAISETEVEEGAEKRKNMSRFWRAGAGFQQKYKDFNLGAGYVYGYDEEPYGHLTDQSIDSQTWFVEALAIVYPWLMPYVRYEGMHLDMPQGAPGVPDRFQSQRIMPGCKAMLRPNIALTIEIPMYFEGAYLEEGFDRSVFMLLSVAY